MSTIGPTLAPDEPQPVAAAPAETPKAAASVPAGAPTGFVPIAAMQDERSNTDRARQEAANYRAHMELAGWSFGEDGTPAPPQSRQETPQPAQGQIPPRVQNLATSLGIDPREFLETLAEAVGPMASSFAAPMAEGSAELYKTIMQQRDPDFDIYAKAIDKHLQYVPVNWRGSPKALELAKNAAMAEHIDEIVKRRIEREKNPGKIVGRFTEGAAPGTQATPVESFSDATLEWARRSGVSEEDLSRAQTNREVSRRSR